MEQMQPFFPSTVLVADPMTLVRESVAQFLETKTNLRVVAQAGNGLLAWQSIETMPPALAILDSSVPQMSCTEICRKSKSAGLPTRLIVVSSRQDRNYMLEVFRSGADAFVLKTDSSISLIEAVNQVLQGRYYVSPIMQNTDAPPQKEIRHAQDPLDMLSNREYQVFTMLVEGIRAKEIAHRLSLSPKTVDTHRASLMRKLDIHDIPGLVKFAISRNLISVS